MTIFWNNIKRIFGSKLNIVFMIVVPVLLNVFVVSISSGDAKYTVGIQDYDQSQYTEELADKLDDTCNVVKLEENDDIKDMVINNKIDIGIVFDNGYTDKLMEGNPEEVKTYSLNDTNAAEPGKMFLESCIAAAKAIGVAANGSKEAFYDGMKDYYSQQYKVDYKKFSISLSEQVELADMSLGYLAFGMIFLMSYSTMMILEDKVNGVYDRISVTPLKGSSYFFQNLLSFFVVAVIQIILLFAILINIVGVSYGETLSDVIQTGVVCGAFALVCISIGIIISRFSRTTMMANAIVMLINIPMLMLGGCFWPPSIMPEYMQKIRVVVPATWFLKAAEKVMYGKGLGAVWPYMAGMLGLAVVLIGISYVVKAEKAR